MSQLGLTEDGVAAAARLTRPPVYVKVGVAVGTPLAQNPRSCVQDVHEMGVRGVQIARAVLAHVEDDGGVQACNNNLDTTTVKAPG